MTPRRRRLSLTELKGTIRLLREGGLTITAMDALPDGTIRRHFAPLPDDKEDAIDRNLAEFDRKHGYR